MTWVAINVNEERKRIGAVYHRFKDETRRALGTSCGRWLDSATEIETAVRVHLRPCKSCWREFPA